MSRTHATKRAWQRYGVALHKTDVLKLEKSIWNGGADWNWDHPTKMQQCYTVKHNKKSLVCVFDIKSDRIVTFLPSGAIFNFDGYRNYAKVS